MQMMTLLRRVEIKSLDVRGEGGGAKVEVQHPVPKIMIHLVPLLMDRCEKTVKKSRLLFLGSKSSADDQ